MSRIVAFLSGLKLSITQWALISLSGALGALILAFRAQGGRLHYAQVALLTQRLEGEEVLARKRVDAARQAFEKAMEVYNAQK